MYFQVKLIHMLLIIDIIKNFTDATRIKNSLLMLCKGAGIFCF